jgi:AcrR family transcriptional regulator
VPSARRAPPLPPDERRRSIVESILPLLLARGPAATTKELAEAAGVAEGTLFSVFEGKHALLLAAIAHRLDPERLSDDLAHVDRADPLRAKLAAAAQAVRPTLADVRALAATAHALPEHARGRRPEPGVVERWHGTLRVHLEELLAPHVDDLRLPPARVAAIFAGLLFANGAGGAAPDPFPADDLVDVLLDGVRARTASGDPACC